MRDAIIQIIQELGGKNNINSVRHCMTRLRFQVKDPNQANQERIKKIAGVLGVNIKGNEIQVIIGNNVDNYYDVALKELGMSQYEDKKESTDSNESTNGKKKFSDIVVSFASALFVPFIGIMAACGTLQGFINLSVALGWLTKSSGTFLVLNTIADAAFYYLPVFIAFNASKVFGGKPFYSVFISLVLLHPSLLAAMHAGTPLTFAGLPLTIFTYAKTVFPIIFASWFASIVERYARKYIPAVLRMIFVPMLVFVITIPLTLLVIGPIFIQVMKVITDLILNMFEFSPIITGAVVGAAWQPLVLFGVSKAFMPIFPANLTNLGYEPFVICTFFAAVFGQAGAVLGYSLKSKNQQVKQVGFAATISALFGITEPALFGVNLTAKKPLIIGAIAGGIGGLYGTVLGVKAFGIATGILGFPVFIGPSGIDGNMIHGLIASAIAFVCALVGTYLFGWSKESEQKFENNF